MFRVNLCSIDVPTVDAIRVVAFSLTKAKVVGTLHVRFRLGFVIFFTNQWHHFLVSADRLVGTQIATARPVHLGGEMSQAISVKAREGVIDLHFQDDSGSVRITPEDNDLMILSVHEAISACRAFADQIRFKSQFDALLVRIGGWIRTRSEKISSAFITTRDAGLLLLIVTKSREYDSDFESDITDLDIQVANEPDFGMIELSVLAIPNCPLESVNSFLSKKMQLRYAIDGDRK